MHREIRLAIEEMQRMPPGRQWFVPVRFDECEVPEFRVGPAEDLRAIQSVDLYPDWDRGVDRLCDTLLGIKDPDDY